EMCGSALRCVTWILHQKTGKKEFSIQTEAGLKTCYVNEDNTVTVNLGIPSMLKHSYLAEGFTGDLVNIGNQHFIVWVNSLQDNPHLQYGSVLEHHKGFEQTVNVHFAVLLNRKTAAIKIWEKGCGATLACGTGAAATVFSGITNGLLDNEVEVFMPGGIVKIVASEKGYLLSGEVCRSFEGVYNWKI
nr:diaminopimelate epimerase [Candidatus Cloacimonas sp.]